MEHGLRRTCREPESGIFECGLRLVVVRESSRIKFEGRDSTTLDSMDNLMKVNAYELLLKIHFNDRRLSDQPGFQLRWWIGLDVWA